MNRSTDLPGEDAVEVLKQYRALAAEQAPAALDAVVLGAARTAAQRGSRPAYRWLRPLSFAAVAVLSFTIVLQVSMQQPASSRLTGDPQVVPSAFEEAGASVAEQVRQAEEIAASPMNGSAVLPDEASPDSPSAMPAATGKMACSEAERASATSWWQCIDALERNGNSVSAERELQDLLAAFPQFNTPE